MEQIGVVNKTYDNMATVQIKRATACGGKCGECGGCEITSHKVDALNTVGAKAGEIVKMEMKDTQILFAAFIVYIIPLIAFFIGYSVGYSIFASELTAGIAGGVLLVLTFTILRFMDKRIRRSNKYQSVITRIIS